MAAVLCAPTRNRATHPTLVVRRNVATAGPYLRRQPAAAKRDSWVRLWLHVCGRGRTVWLRTGCCAKSGHGTCRPQQVFDVQLCARSWGACVWGGASRA